MSRRTEAGAVNVLEVFRWTGAFHVVVNVASLVRWALRALLKQARLCNEGGAVALRTVSWLSIGARGVIITTFTDAIVVLVLYERPGTATNSAEIVRVLIRRTRLAVGWVI